MSVSGMDAMQLGLPRKGLWVFSPNRDEYAVRSGPRGRKVRRMLRRARKNAWPRPDVDFRQFRTVEELEDAVFEAHPNPLRWEARMAPLAPMFVGKLVLKP